MRFSHFCCERRGERVCRPAFTLCTHTGSERAIRYADFIFRLLPLCVYARLCVCILYTHEPLSLFVSATLHNGGVLYENAGILLCFMSSDVCVYSIDRV